ncbi:M81 family metallopeptidase [Phycisphaera mikurensis]|uniref:Microcystin degradation protein MlrC n=1 Tax=Phycisphaera mikurensis (strain NBRC 102666 / KCTC 22515 / FYK2301M01) TaxID=1142394 RepID=I0ICQ2_PHYMF|nr:M81 family metallopeptidase [Phycisphaera mikurensis]MBB6442086.1 microcystin degradation protein MlrC [Phycisphaera mikurensis]BAM03040.1 hypothetical protein PSMK_08810 [Phycisphaera mikurensis NBRC 102666]
MPTDPPAERPPEPSRPLRVGILGLFHESNTFATHPATLAAFRGYEWFEGDALRAAMVDNHDEVGGMLGGLDEAEGVEAVPLLWAAALPAGEIEPEAEAALWAAAERQLDAAGALDAVLAVPHGAAVGRTHRDFDGWWLTRLREKLGRGVPIVATLDPHANVSAAMVEAADALLAYRTNPHVDQRAIGGRAARLILRTLRGEVRPATAWVPLPLLLDIERQLTDEPPCRDWLAEGDRLGGGTGVLETSLILGYPFADVPELGAGVLVVTDADQRDPDPIAAGWARRIWADREQARPRLLPVEEAAAAAASATGTSGLLDMGDNVGGGSYGDQTALAHALLAAGATPLFVSLRDPEAQAAARAAGVGGRVDLLAGGRHEPALCGPPLRVSGEVVKLTDGAWTDPQPLHGGRVRYAEGPLAHVRLDDGSVVQLGGVAIFPASLGQITHAGLDPAGFRAIVIKGVHAPVAAYRDAVTRLVRVDSPGPTSANALTREYRHRPRPMFPFEEDAAFPVAAAAAG